MITSWRIVKAKHAAGAFDGEGARVAGGRWNSPGVAMVYTSQSAALAALEMLVHLGRSRTLAGYVIFSCEFDDRIAENLEPRVLPHDWPAYPAPASLQRIGDRWVYELRSAVLRVPSAVVEGESNFLLNPGHPDFRRIHISKPRPFGFDPRLVP
ncbi:MAG TPA: RES family NAD+ phosphorylase [Thermoanaerobaculia bacterium]|nr:RES family NAD+ phosphorylase [Thermoanaerobaculia bacterium]